MTQFARVEDGRVREVLTIADDTSLEYLYHEDFVAECHPVLYGAPVQAGWLYDGHLFSAPPPPPRITILSSQDFLARLTPEERAAMMAAFSNHPSVFMFLLTTMASPTVDLAAEATVTGIHATRDAGILSAERATAVLA